MHKFGGDDFGEYVPMAQLEKVVCADHIDSVTIRLTESQVILIGNQNRSRRVLTPPPTKPTPKKQEAPKVAPADRVSCRQFFINTLTENPDIAFPEMFELLKAQYSDTKAGSNEKSAKNQFAYYKSQTKRLNNAKQSLLDQLKNS